MRASRTYFSLLLLFVLYSHRWRPTLHHTAEISLVSPFLFPSLLLRPNLRNQYINKNTRKKVKTNLNQKSKNKTKETLAWGYNINVGWKRRSGEGREKDCASHGAQQVLLAHGVSNMILVEYLFKTANASNVYTLRNLRMTHQSHSFLPYSGLLFVSKFCIKRYPIWHKMWQCVRDLIYYRY